MFGEEYLVGKTVEGLAKGASSTLLKRGLRSSNDQNSPLSKPKKCFWGADGQLYCPVNKLPKQQRQVKDMRVLGSDPLQRQPERPPTDFTKPAAEPWKQEFQTDTFELKSFSDERTTFKDSVF